MTIIRVEMIQESTKRQRSLLKIFMERFFNFIVFFFFYISVNTYISITRAILLTHQTHTDRLCLLSQFLRCSHTGNSQINLNFKFLCLKAWKTPRVQHFFFCISIVHLLLKINVLGMLHCSNWARFVPLFETSQARTRARWPGCQREHGVVRHFMRKLSIFQLSATKAASRATGGRMLKW